MVKQTIITVMKRFTVLLSVMTPFAFCDIFKCACTKVQK